MDDKWNRIADGDSDSLLADFLALRERAEKAEAALNAVEAIVAEYEEPDPWPDAPEVSIHGISRGLRRIMAGRLREALAGKGERR